jgi:hypothetical protein
MKYQVFCDTQLVFETNEYTEVRDFLRYTECIQRDGKYFFLRSDGVLYELVQR